MVITAILAMILAIVIHKSTRHGATPMDDHIGWPQIRVQVSAATYEKLFRRAHEDMVQDMRGRRTAYHASTIVDAALARYLDR